MTRAADVDAAFVLAKRRMGAGWGAIARMAGCPEQALRKHHDATWTAASWNAAPVEPVLPIEVVRKALRKRGLSPDNALIVARLWLANGARVSSAKLAAGIAGGAGASKACCEAKSAGARLGLTFCDRKVNGFGLTPEGVVKLSEMAGLRGRP